MADTCKRQELMSIPAAYMLCVLLLFCIFVDVVDEAFCLDDLLHKLWECLTLILGSLCLVIDHTAVKIDLNGVPCFNFFGCSRALNDRKTDIDRIAIKVQMSPQ